MLSHFLSFLLVRMKEEKEVFFSAKAPGKINDYVYSKTLPNKTLFPGSLTVHHSLHTTKESYVSFANFSSVKTYTAFKKLSTSA